MRVLVTGATGFMGRHLVSALKGRGDEVLSASRAGQGPPGSAQHVAHDFAGARPFPDVGRLDAVIHLAATSSADLAREQLAATALTNGQGTLHAVEVALREGAQFVLASSQRVYQPAGEPISEDNKREPTDPYGYTKLAAELYVEMAGRLLGLRGSILRFFTVYGPGQVISSGQSGVVAIFGWRAVRGKPLRVLGRQRKDFVEVSDAVAGMLCALDHPSQPPRPYNIATGQAVSVLELAREVAAAAGGPQEIDEDYSEGDPGSLVADITRAHEELGYMPRIGLQEGVRRYIEWLRTASAHPS